MIVERLHPVQGENLTHRPLTEGHHQIIYCGIHVENGALRQKLWLKNSVAANEHKRPEYASLEAWKRCSQKQFEESRGSYFAPYVSQNNSSADTLDLEIIVDSGAPDHVVNDISLFKNVLDVEPITGFLPDGYQVTAKQCGTLHMNIGMANVFFVSCLIHPIVDIEFIFMLETGRVRHLSYLF